MDREESIVEIARINHSYYGLYCYDVAREIMEALEGMGYHKHDFTAEAPPKTQKIFDASEVTGIL